MTPTSAARMPILMYHSLDSTGSVISVTPKVFAEQMQCLADQGVRGIALRDAVAHQRAHGVWPAGCAVITFDDGYANFCDAALAPLACHGFTATVFVVSGHIGRSNDWAPPPPGLGAQSILSAQQLRDLTEAGIEIGAHTRSHPDLRLLSPGAAEAEIVASRVDLEGQLGQQVGSFAYPFGNLTPAAVEIVRREFQAACTTALRRAGDESPHTLPRVDMFYVRAPQMLERLVRGELDGYLTLRRWGRALRSLGVG
jgi:peptidoglycan/xylan/chitin deacetylase (PgdA/CDA1 family)